jgi:succinyl-diaminopimelate desuccinylase
MSNTSDFRTKLDAFFEMHKDQLIETITRLVAVKSVKEDPQPGMPFGPGPALALALGLDISASLGFNTRNFENYVGTVDLSDQETRLGILCHLDVVDEGTGWSTPPYQAIVKDGMIYGRGCGDDKGPAVAALFAMQAVKELGVPLKYNTRLILGTDEECGSSDLAYYLTRQKTPPYVFSPDGDFPVYNTEKGSLRPTLTKSWKVSDALPRVSSIQAGKTLNAIPAEARALIQGFSLSQVQAYCDSLPTCDASFTISPSSDGLILTAHGKSEHVAVPHNGCNALTALLDLLATLPLAENESASAINTMHSLFPHGDHYGNALKIAQAEELTGPLTLSLTIIDFGPEGFTARFDSRTPLCATKENTEQIARNILAQYGIRMEGHLTPPHHTPADTPFVKTLLAAYEQYSGQPGYCKSTGGGTYVHDIEGGVCFGPMMPGFDSCIHCPDEHASIADLITAAKIYAQVIVDLCG